MANDADTEDIVAEAFLKAARSFSSFDPARAKFSTWVVTIAKNCMISHFRKKRPTTALDDVPQEACAVDGDQEAVENRNLAEQLLSCLDETERELVLYKYRDDMRNVDIARILGMNPSTVSTKLANALAKMRKAFERNA